MIPRISIKFDIKEQLWWQAWGAVAALVAILG